MTTALRRAAELLPAILVGIAIATFGAATFVPAAVLTTSAWALLAIVVVAQRRSGWVSTRVDLPLCGLLAAVLLSAAFSPSPARALETHAFVPFSMAVFFLTTQIVREPAAVKRMSAAILVVAVITACVGAVREPLFARPLVNPNHNAALFASALPLASALVLSARAQRTSWVRPAAGAAAAILLAALLLTGSMGALGALAIVGSVAAALALARTRRLALIPVVVTGVAGVALLLLAQPVIGRWTPGAVSVSLAERVAIWQAAAMGFMHRPLLGTGPGTFPHLFALYRDPEVPYAVQYAHQEVFHVLAEMGVVGLLALLLTAAAWLSAVRRVFRQRDFPLYSYAVGLVCGVLVVVVHAQVDFSHRLPAVAGFVAWLAACACAAVRTERAARRVYLELPTCPPRLTWAAAAASAILAGAALTTLWAPRPQRELERGRAAFASALDGHPDEFQVAAAHFERAAALDPLDAATRADLARVYDILGDDARALEEFEAAHARDPLHPTWARARADALWERGDTVAAVAAYRKILQTHPNQAVDIFEQVVRARPVVAETLFDDPLQRARLFAGLQQWPGALEAYRKASLQHASAAVRQEAATAALRAGDPSAARTWLDQASPTDAEEWNVSGHLYLELGDTSAAQRAFEKALEHDPASSDAQRGLAEIAARADDWTLARAHWETLIENEPTDAGAHLALSRIASRQGDPQTALRLARQARRLEPCNPSVVSHLSSLYEKNGLRMSAARELEDAARRCDEPSYLSRLDALRGSQ